MRLLIQRVTEARVEVDGYVTGSIARGLLVFIGIARSDTPKDADYLADKLVTLRIFDDADGKMNRSIRDVGGSLLIVSQFTLYADSRRGRRPSYHLAASPAEALPLYSYFIDNVRSTGIHTETGSFQSSMRIALVNDGPVTIICDSPESSTT
jgi:D-tyrosyl-tRNA(Tyr) deacylase